MIKITVNEKFEEARFFLERIKEPLTPIEIGHYYSAFLSSVNSIFDHILEDANNKFFVGISLDENLDSRKFRMITEYSGNIRAKKFIDWYDDVFKLIRKTESGKIFHVKRNLNIHRRIETPTLFASFQTGDNIRGDFMTTMQFATGISKKEAEQYYDQHTKKFFLGINQLRKKNNKPQCTSIVTSLYFSLGDSESINLAEACKKFLDDINNYVVTKFNDEFYLRRQMNKT